MHLVRGLLPWRLLTAAIISNFISLNVFWNPSIVKSWKRPTLPDGILWVRCFAWHHPSDFRLAYHRLTLALPKIYKTLFPKVATYNYCLIAFMLIIPLGMWNPHVLGGGGRVGISSPLKKITLFNFYWDFSFVLFIQWFTEQDFLEEFLPILLGRLISLCRILNWFLRGGPKCTSEFRILCDGGILCSDWGKPL